MTPVVVPLLVSITALLFLLRLCLVHRYITKKLDEVYLATLIDIKHSALWEWRYRRFEALDLIKMSLMFWKPIKSFPYDHRMTDLEVVIYDEKELETK